MWVWLDQQVHASRPHSPSDNATQNYTPNPYMNSNLTKKLIMTVSAKDINPKKGVRIQVKLRLTMFRLPCMLRHQCKWPNKPRFVVGDIVSKICYNDYVKICLPVQRDVGPPVWFSLDSSWFWRMPFLISHIVKFYGTSSSLIRQCLAEPLQRYHIEYG